MSLYVCSTLRHLLFSLSRSASLPEEKSVILFFYDYQNVDKEKIQSKVSNKNIKIILLSRKELVAKFKMSLLGRVLLFYSMRSIKPTEIIKTLAINEIIKVVPLETHYLHKLSLFLFNDRNRTARIFKLLTKNYEIIEDGVGNYYEIPQKGISKYVNPLNVKGLNTWVMGESSRCTSINVVTPEMLPSSVREKGETIDFLGNIESLSIINTVFKFTPKLTNEHLDVVIIATQPLSSSLANKIKDKNYFLNLHQEIAKHIESKGLSVFIKLHPSEDIEDYRLYFDTDKLLSVKHPLELELLNSSNKITVASINSTAGLGFEKFCERRRLFKDEEMGIFDEQIMSWKNNPHLLKERLEETFNSL
ncbi:polysialyltransferase family glycosyltransferase [Vibrio lentus]